jgi:hypothetical protein
MQIKYSTLIARFLHKLLYHKAILSTAKMTYALCYDLPSKKYHTPQKTSILLWPTLELLFVRQPSSLGSAHPITNYFFTL